MGRLWKSFFVMAPRGNFMRFACLSCLVELSKLNPRQGDS